MAIHPTAIVDARAELDPSAEVGAYAIIERDVVIGPDTVIHPHAFVGRYVTLGRRCHVHPFAVVGHPPQDRAFTEGPSYVRLGDDVLVREGATIHRGTTPGSTTVVGERVFLMANAHVAHNCLVEDDVVLVNGALLGGHVQVGPRAFIGGNAAIHQWCRVGELAIVGGLCAVRVDVPPFCKFDAGGVLGLNVVGLRRAGFSREQRDELKSCYRLLYRSGRLFRDALAEIERSATTPPGRRLVAFLTAESRRGVGGPAHRNAAAANTADEPG